MEKVYRKRIDFSENKEKSLWESEEKKVAKHVADMQMTKLSGSSNGLITFDGEIFILNFEVAEDHVEVLYDWAKQICEYRLHTYFERKSE